MLQDVHLQAFKSGDWSAAEDLAYLSVPFTCRLKAVAWQSLGITDADLPVTIARNQEASSHSFTIPELTGVDTASGVHNIPANSLMDLSKGDLVTLAGDGAIGADDAVHFTFIFDVNPPINVSGIYVFGNDAGDVELSRVAAIHKRGYLTDIGWALHTDKTGGEATIGIFRNAVDTGETFAIPNGVAGAADGSGVATFAVGLEALFFEEGDELTFSNGGQGAAGRYDANAILRN